MWLSPALTVRRRSRSSVAVRRRCHAVRHSPRASGLLLAALARPLLHFGLAALRPATLVEVATRRAFHRLVATTPSVRRPTALPLLPLTHGPAPFRWSASPRGIQPGTPRSHTAGRTAGGIGRSGRTRVSTSGALFEVHAFQLWWCGTSEGAGEFTCVHSRLSAGAGTASDLA